MFLAAVPSWTLPFGKGQHFASNANRVLDGFIGGWNVDAVISAQTGFPVSLNTGYYDNCNHQYAPDGGPKLNNYLYNNYSSGNPLGCYASIPQYGLSNLPNQISQVRQPSIVNVDFGLHKDFAITESKRLQVRAEAQNLTNTVSVSRSRYQSWRRTSQGAVERHLHRVWDGELVSTEFSAGRSARSKVLFLKWGSDCSPQFC